MIHKTFRKMSLCSLALLMASSFITLPIPAHADEGARSVAEIEAIVRDYIIANPEIVLDALRELERRDQAAVAAAQSDAIVGLEPTLTASPLTPIFGNEQGDVTLIEFFDYNCGFCKRMFPTVQNVMDQDDKLRVIFVELPILSETSVVAARAALASQEQGKYLDYHTALMTHQGRLTEEVVFEKAAEVGIDIAKLRADMESPQITDYLSMTQSLAQAMQVRGTPASVIGDQFFGGFIRENEMQTAIARARGEES